MLLAQDLADTMLIATFDYIIPTSPLVALANAISTYIVDNAEIAFTWEAVNTIPPNDTESIATTGEIITCPIVFTPSMAIVPQIGLTYLMLELVAGIKLGTFNITAGGWSTTAQLMSDCPAFTLYIDGTGDRDSAFLQMATQIVNQIKAYSPGTPIPGTHGTYSGASTSAIIS